MSRSRPAEALAASGLFLLCWGLVHTWFWSRGQIVDWPTYKEYGTAMLDGRIPYRDFPVEYPPGALPVFVAAAPFADYAHAFEWVMAVCGVALVATLSFGRREAMWFAAASPVLVGSLVLSRFDLWPALLATAAVVLLLRERPRWAYAFLGAAIAAKLWPAVLVPLFLVRTRRGLAWGAAVLLAAFLPFVALSPGGVWSSLSGQAGRPLQIESLGASLVMAFGTPHVVSGSGSQNVAGHGALAAASSGVQLLALAAVWLSYWRTRRGFERHAAAAVAAFIAFGKVFSPQFLVWLVPLVPLASRAATALLTAVLLLTQVWFPQRYWEYVNERRLAGVVVARDLLVVALVLLLVLAASTRMHHSWPFNSAGGKEWLAHPWRRRSKTGSWRRSTGVH